MKKLLHFFFIFGLIIISPKMICAQSISITDISPASPASFKLNQQVSIHFTYSIPQASGVRIFIRPMTSGSLTPQYAASGSPVYSQGHGQGSATFTITSGNASIDQLRVQVLSADQNQMIFEFLVPVKFTFSSAVRALNPAIRNQMINRTRRQNFTQIQPDTTKKDSAFKSPSVIKRIVKPDGTIETYYSDGTISGMKSTGKRYFVRANGDTLSFQAYFIEVQGASKPAAPPGFISEVDTDMDENWLVNLNAWIEYIGNLLLNDIKTLVNDDTSFQNYEQFEQKNSSSLYETVNLRYLFLEKLLQQGF